MTNASLPKTAVAEQALELLHDCRRDGVPGPITQALADALGVLRPSASRALNKLYREGLVERGSDGWAITEAGLELHLLRKTMGGIARRDASPVGVYKKARIPDEIRWTVWERDDFTCRGCGVRRYLTCDHIVPESKGGPTTLDNLQTLCKSCNSRKGVA